MNIARFEPWTFVDLLRRDLDRLADPRRPAATDHDSVVDWAPAVDIFEEKNRYLLRAYHQTAGNFWRTLVPASFRDLQALIYVLLLERSSLGAYAWLWRHRREIRSRRRLIQARRTEPPRAVDRWFSRKHIPLADLAGS